jgi:arabinoxylan arabinofuranohydrolase
MNKLKIYVCAVIATTVFVLNPHFLFSKNSKPKDTKGSSAEKVVNNPIIQNLGVCDPHIHIFNNKAYLFASHDREPVESFYGMYDWWIWSSSDLVHWELEFNLFPKDMWVGPTNNAWAVDGAERNGKYYFYVSGNWNTGIAVSTDGPGGPYNDALGKSIGVSYDPTVFIDDDENKTPYLITSGFPYKIAKLNDDMISLAEEPKELIHTTVDWKGDGGFMHKRNGVYYLNGHGTSYKTATNIYGPYTYIGKFYKNWIDHPTIFNWNNQTYCAFGMGDVGKFFRKTHLTYVHYKDNGDIVADGDVGDSFIGVGQYDCSKKIEAEWYFAASDGTRKQEIASGFAVSNLTNTASLYYPRVLNVAAKATISIHVSSASSGGIIEVRQDKPTGKVLGKIAVPNTGSLSTYQNVSTKLKNKEGLTNIYLVYKGGTGNSANLDWLTISSTGAIQQPPKEKPIILAAKPTESTPSVSAFRQIEAEDLICYSVLRTSNSKDDGPIRCISNLKNLSYSSYKIDFGPKANNSLTFQARLSSLKPGSIEIRLDSEKGALLGNCEFENTEGLQKWVTKECKVNAPAGVQHIFLVFRGEEEEKYSNATQILNLNWIKFVD